MARRRRPSSAEPFGSIEGLRIVEIGAGRGLNALLFAKPGRR